MAGGLVNMEDAACNRLAELVLNVEEVRRGSCTKLSVPSAACQSPASALLCQTKRLLLALMSRRQLASDMLGLDMAYCPGSACRQPASSSFAVKEQKTGSTAASASTRPVPQHSLLQRLPCWCRLQGRPSGRPSAATRWLQMLSRIRPPAVLLEPSCGLLSRSAALNALPPFQPVAEQWISGLQLLGFSLSCELC